MGDEIKAKAGNPERMSYYRPSIERLRIVLMFFMCINLLGFPTAFGELVKTFCGFVPLAFFILSGYLVLREDENRSRRIVRAIKRTAIVFGVLAVVYFAINCIYHQRMGSNILHVFGSERFWFNFLVMNVWQFDLCGAIWYVQALLYAYIIIYFLDKWKLLRFDWIIAAVLILLTVFLGELSGVFRWNVAGYTYIPGNFLTRALPYTLLGGFIHKRMRLFAAIQRVWWYFGIFGGIVLMFTEMLLLSSFNLQGYYGHLIGMGVVAVSVCMLAFTGDRYPGFEESLGMSRWHINCIYYLCQPVSIGLALLISGLSVEITGRIIGYIGIITFVICFGLAWLIACISRACFKKKANG